MKNGTLSDPGHLMIAAAGHVPPPGASSSQYSRALDASVVRLLDIATRLLTGRVQCLSFFDTLLEDLVSRGAGGLLTSALSRHIPEGRLPGGASLRLLGDLSFIPSEFRPRDQLPVSFPCLVWLMNYTGTGELVQAAASMARDPGAELTPQEFQARLLTSGLPDPDLIVLTGATAHVPNVLLYQLAYSELHFSPVPWSSFTADHLEKALESYRERDRRYGKV